jgi:cell division protein FtsI/penicillin-binding protein 2
MNVFNGDLFLRAFSGIFNTASWCLCALGIGQGFMTASPLQLAVATAALANKGVIIQPKLLKSTQAPVFGFSIGANPVNKA